MPPEDDHNSDQIDLDAALKEKFLLLPKVVQDAITSANVQKQLRTLAEGRKLHVDQWAKLENEVLLTLMGFQPITELQNNIQSGIGVPAEIASALAEDISKIVFEPIREELERQLEHPEAKEVEVSPQEAARQSILTNNENTATDNTITAQKTPDTTIPAPATPAPAAPTEKAVRAPVSSSYTSRQPSTDRKSVSGDPYRELP